MSENKIRLLMETTGCNRYEADLAIKSSGGDFVGALNFLNNAMARLEIIRGKFMSQKNFIYGAFLFISDIKKGAPLSASAVLSNNPAVYEINISSPWEEIEKFIYSARLSSGSLPELSGILQEEFSRILGDLCSGSPLDIEGKIKDTVSAVLNTTAEDIRIFAERSEEPYKTPSAQVFPVGGTDGNKPLPQPSAEKEKGVEYLPAWYDTRRESKRSPRTSAIVLDVEPLSLPSDDKTPAGAVATDFVTASAISAGDAVWVRVSDTREVALYLAERLGAFKDGRFLPIVCEVSSVKSDGEYVVMEVKFAENISGRCRIYSQDKIKTLTSASRAVDGGLLNISSLWQKIFKKIGGGRR